MNPRCSWEVTAGSISDDDDRDMQENEVDPQHTKHWFLTAEEWQKPNRLQLLVEKNAAVEAYALSLRVEAIQPESEIDWVRVQFHWLRE